jgi:acyl CoA:acetate/3-ketoacid CoA transferase beta subunit
VFVGMGLAGSGAAAADIATMAKRCIVIMNH